MGKALASPKALPLLILVPILIMTACIFLTAPRAEDGGFVFMQSDVVDFNYFLPHSSVDAIFVFGNILIFIFAAVGFARFWKMLKTSGETSQLTFLQAAGLTVKEILSHDKFRQCGTNHPRAIAHMFLLFGFIGAMITTALVLVFVFIPHYLELLGAESLKSFFHVPIDLPHPVKILGVLSGIALTIGGGMLLYRRWTNKDEVGANGYADYLFLYVMFLTGLTGMTSWLARLSGVSMLAYANYFVHILCVYFLLWYMPYSKFAHMIYRTLAIIHARSIGRVKE
jgi:quinone-modifying oxidoreductase subunit QmoC